MCPPKGGLYGDSIVQLFRGHYISLGGWASAHELRRQETVHASPRLSLLHFPELSRRSEQGGIMRGVGGECAGGEGGLRDAGRVYAGL